MNDAWMPGAERIWGTTDGGPLKGGAPRAVWQTLGADPRTVSAGTAAQRLNKLDRACHLVWNPLRGEIVQVIPILRAGRLLGSPEDLNEMAHRKPGAGAGQPPEVNAAGQPPEVNAAGQPPEVNAAGQPPEVNAEGQPPEVNAEGRLCVQIGVVAFAWEPFTAWPMTGLQQILEWLSSWGISRQWPAGRPASFPHGLTTSGSRRLWARGGHFGASQVPGLTAAGPGAVDVELLSGRAIQARQLERPGHTAARAARVPAAAVTLAGEPGTDRQAAPAEIGDLYGYLDNDAAATAGAATAGAVSRVG